jgi:predicted TIM-barrel fold metal-dependent hydrolase
MAVHIHSFEGGGGFYAVNESDPFLLESAFNDPDLRKTNFVIIHGGGIFSAHAAAMLWKPNVYADFSLMVLVYPTPQVAAVLHDWLAQFPEKILFGTDAGPLNPDQQWDIATLSGTNTARTALGMALTTMMNNGEVTRRRAEEIATAVMRGNASRLYGLKLN